jgi:hypothetical protein
MNEPPSVFRNEGGKGSAIVIELAGTKSNRSAIGARVTLEAGDLRLIDEVRSGSSYASQSDFRLHFGLGETTEIDRIEVRWPNGAVEEFSTVAGNQFLKIREGQGVVSKSPFGSGR